MTDAADVALIAVDVQGDFLPGGSLAVTRGDEVIAPLVATARAVPLVVATRDWHPPDHVSFVARGGPWPVHCVAGTAGAAIAIEIDRLASLVVSKGTDPDVDAYSGFDGTGLAEILRALGIRRVAVGGLATDFCVRATVLDALRSGFETAVIRDAVRAVEVQPGDGDRAMAEMAAAGAVLRSAAELAPA